MVGQSSFQAASITAEAAWALTDAAAKAAAEQGVSVCIAVVDPQGVLKAFLRMDGALAIAVESCQAKARAALMGMGSLELGDALTGHWPALLSFANDESISLLGGGLPVLEGEQQIGAIGVGGASADQDIVIARQALLACHLAD